MNICICGCNTEIKEFRSDGLPQRYVLGHTNKGKSNYWKTKKNVKKRTLHERATKICDETICRINNKDCLGRLDTAHLDGDDFNNKRKNLAKLCRAHHFILDKRKLTLEQLKNLVLVYYVDKSGKRRYAK